MAGTVKSKYLVLLGIFAYLYGGFMLICWLLHYIGIINFPMPIAVPIIAVSLIVYQSLIFRLVVQHWSRKAAYVTGVALLAVAIVILTFVTGGYGSLNNVAMIVLVFLSALLGVGVPAAFVGISLLGYILAVSNFIPSLGDTGAGTVVTLLYVAAAVLGWLLFHRYYVAQDPVTDDLQRALAAEQLQSAAVLASIKDGVSIVNREGVVVHANEHFLDMVALTRKELIGKHYSEVVSTKLRIVSSSAESPRLGPNIAKVFKTGRPVTIDSETIEYFDNRPSIDISLSITPLKNDDDEVSAVLIIGRDISHIMRLQRMKDSLIATASHELRTPITVIAGYADLLLGASSSNLTEKQHHYLERTKETTNHLTEMVNDMLDISRLESGQRENNPEKIDNIELLQTAVEDELGVFASKQVSLKLDAKPGKIYADNSRLQQVVHCLLSNALKFAPEGGAVVLASEVTGNTMTISVSDNGPGIPKDRHEAIFEKFTKLDTTGSIQGAGLGLAIAKNIVEHWKGTIGIEDIEPHGAKFFFTVPLYDETKAKEKHSKGGVK